MINWVLIVPILGFCLLVWGLVRRNKVALWGGVGLVVAFLAAGLIDYWLE